jgi:hypothetical protein
LLHTFTWNISAKIDAFSLKSIAIRHIKGKKGKMYDRCLNWLMNKPSLLFYQLHQYRRFLAGQQLRQNQQPRVQKRNIKRWVEASVKLNKVERDAKGKGWSSSAQADWIHDQLAEELCP